ncbi:MAG: ribbon-helix-helix protein, CopG family [Nitrospinae bacterium]|nr:ribbon-helix-helix protein, CopG family [Nitrospinota bacterium]
MITLRIPKDAEDKLVKLANKTGKSKSYYARRALLDFLQDKEDYDIAMARVKKGRPTISIDEAEKRLGLKD